MQKIDVSLKSITLAFNEYRAYFLQTRILRGSNCTLPTTSTFARKSDALVEYCVRLIVVVVIGIDVAAVTMVVAVVSVVSLLLLVLLFLKLMTT